MNGREGLMRLNYHLPESRAALALRVLSAHRYLRAVFQAVESAGGQRESGIDPLHRRYLLVAGERGDGLHGDRVVGLHNVDERGGAVVLHGRRREPA